MKLSTVFTDKKFFKWFLTLAAPIALQTLLTALLNTADTIMVGQLGETAIAGTSLANQAFFILMLIINGVVSGCAIFISQFWGKKDIPNIRKTVALSLLISVGISAVFTAFACTVPKAFMRLFTPDSEVIGYGALYLGTVAISYIPFALTVTLNTAIRTVERPKLPLFTAIMALVVNVALNYVFIFGRLGFQIGRASCRERV